MEICRRDLPLLYLWVWAMMSLRKAHWGAEEGENRYRRVTRPSWVRGASQGEISWSSASSLNHTEFLNGSQYSPLTPSNQSPLLYCTSYSTSAFL